MLQRRLRESSREVIIRIRKVFEVCSSKCNSNNQLSMYLTGEEEFDFQNAEVHHVCEKPFTNEIEREFEYVDPELLGIEEEDCVYYSDGLDDNKSEKYMKLRDHCNLSGKYRGAAHKAFNVN